MHSIQVSNDQIVRIYRKAIGTPHLDAYVLGVSEELVLLQPVRDRVDLDGYDVIRVQDVSRITISPRKRFYELALAIKEIRPTMPRGVRLDNVRMLLLSLEKEARLVVIHREILEPDSCEIGRMRSIGRQTYRLDWMNPNAVFESDERKFRFADVTRVQFDGAYENTLAAVANVKRTSSR